VALPMLIGFTVETIPNFIPGDLVLPAAFAITTKANGPTYYPHALRSRVLRFFNL
jgi:hypothetical protein